MLFGKWHLNMEIFMELSSHMFTLRSEDYINGWGLSTEEMKRLRSFKFG